MRLQLQITWINATEYEPEKGDNIIEKIENNLSKTHSCKNVTITINQNYVHVN